MTAERRFLLPWLWSAGIITVVRLLHAARLDYDITLQIQAAQNLLAGNGLTLYWRASENIATPLALHGLTHYAAGYSLYAAALMALGLSPAAFVKIWGSLATLVGWWGWGRLASIYMSGGARRNRVWQVAALWIAGVSPLLFTSRWGGTDIVLWAAVPWVLTLMTRAPEPRAQLEFKFDILAGFLVGVCVLVRYASLFLVPFSLLVIVCQSQLRGALLAKRLAAFGAGLAPGVALQACIVVAFFEGSPPGGVSLPGDQLTAAGARAWERLTTLAAANQGVFFWLPGTLRFWTFDGYQLPALLLAAVVLIGLPLFLITTFRQPVSACYYDLRVVAAGLLVVLPLFLWVCGLMGEYLYVADRRYYEPLRPLMVCIAYSLATMNVAGTRRRLAAVVWSSRAYVFAFVLVTAVEMGTAFTRTPAGDIWRTVVLGAEPRPWPSFSLTYEFSEARRFVLNLMKDDPAAMLITIREAWFHAEPTADRSRILREELCAASPQVTHIRGPVRFLILDSDPATHPAQATWPDDQPDFHGCWPQLPDVRLIRRFSDERLKVLEADIPEGVRLEVKRAVSASE